MKNRNLITKYLILILPLLFMSLNAQDDVDPVEAASQAKAVAEAAVEEVATPEGEESATGEAGEAALAEETFDTLAAVVEGEFDSLDDFLSRVDLNLADAMALTNADCFKSLALKLTHRELAYQVAGFYLQHGVHFLWPFCCPGLDTKQLNPKKFKVTFIEQKKTEPEALFSVESFRCLK